MLAKIEKRNGKRTFFANFVSYYLLFINIIILVFTRCCSLRALALHRTKSYRRKMCAVYNIIYCANEWWEKRHRRCHICASLQMRRKCEKSAVRISTRSKVAEWSTEQKKGNPHHTEKLLQDGENGEKNRSEVIMKSYHNICSFLWVAFFQSGYKPYVENALHSYPICSTIAKYPVIGTAVVGKCNNTVRTQTLTIANIVRCHE